MLYAFNTSLRELKEIHEADQVTLQNAVWIDLVSPSKLEETLVEEALQIDIPTREEMHEIELSSRLYKENGSLFMTATMIAESNSIHMKYDAVTFVLTNKQLITLRYIEPQAIKAFAQQISKHFFQDDATTLFIDLLDITVDRLADILEVVGKHLEEFSKALFKPEVPLNSTNQLDYQWLLQQIGSNGDVNTKARESLLSFNRAMTFLSQNIKLNEDNQARLSMLSKDILSLSDHANFISSKVNFLLDATLGLVSIEQNKIIKIFSVAAVIFLPPTLIASIYGMNFRHMPELDWHAGYLFAICLMLLSAWLPYKYFKHRKWL